MSVSQEQPWSNNLNAPKIPYYLYVAEKSRFAGVSLISIGFGTCKASHLKVRLSVLNPLDGSYRHPRRVVLPMHGCAA